MQSIYDYLDYRRFLSDRFLELKRRNPAFSYRAFNRLAGVRSSGFLGLVISGKRNLAEDGIRMIARGFHLDDEDRRYFEILVRFNQTRDSEEKGRFFRELSQNRKFIAARPLTAAQYRLFSNWYYAVILELVRTGTDEIKDAGWIRRRLHPPVGLKEIKRATQELQALDLLTEDGQGNLVRKETMLKTEDEVKAVSVVNFHVQMSEMAIRSVLKDKGREREFSALTIAMSEKGFQRAKALIQKFRKSLHSMLEEEVPDPKTFVGQINFQLFKLSKTGGDL